MAVDSQPAADPAWLAAALLDKKPDIGVFGSTAKAEKAYRKALREGYDSLCESGVWCRRVLGMTAWGLDS
jgi:hypothetical protein